MTMQVTPRVPASPPFACRGFTEMRFIRMNELTLPAAALYQIVEDAALSRFEKTRKRLIKVFKSAKEPLRGILDFVLGPWITSREFLALWNWESLMFYTFYSHFLATQCKDNKSVFLEVLCSRFHLQVLRADEVPEGDLDPLHMADCPGGVVLLYKHYDPSNFLTTPCGHMHHKYRLFAEGRKLARGKPMNCDQFAQLHIPCVDGCKENLSNLVFATGKSVSTDCGEEIAARGGALLAGLLDPSELVTPLKCEQVANVCGVCNSSAGVPVCLSNCVACESCCTLSILSKKGHRCPLLCSKRMRKAVFAKSAERARSIQGIAPVWDLLRCEECRQVRNCTEFERGWDTAFEKLLCDRCAVEAAASSTSFLSLRSVSKADMILMFPEAVSIQKKYALGTQTAFPLTSSELSALGEQSDKATKECCNCKFGKGINDYFYSQKLLHKCLVCDECLNTGFSGEDFPRKCSYCQYNYEPADLRSLANTPDAFCILCCGCQQLQTAEHYQYSRLISHWWLCRVCDTCLGRAGKTGSVEFCPVCSGSYTHLDEKVMATILVRTQQAEECDARKNCRPAELVIDEYVRENCRPAELVINEYLKKCCLCHTENIRSFQVVTALSHSCPICDYCFISAKFQGQYECPLCSQSVPKEGRDILEQLVVKDYTQCTQCRSLHRHMQPSSSVPRIVPLPTICPGCAQVNTEVVYGRLRGAGLKECKCGRRPFSSLLGCPSGCTCLLCASEELLLFRRDKCASCNAQFAVQFPLQIHCSHCERPLDLTSLEPQQQVYSICEGLHALCCFCVQLSAPCCAVCKCKVRCDKLAEVRSEQRKWEFACFCGFRPGYTVSLSCKHEVHRRSACTLKRCRLCESSQRPTQRSPSLLNYVKRLR